MTRDVNNQELMHFVLWEVLEDLNFLTSLIDLQIIQVQAYSWNY